MNSTIPFDVRLKEDGSYGYAEAKPNNTISVQQLAKKAIAFTGVNFSQTIVQAIISAAMEAAKIEVAEGNLVYIPCEDGTALSFYPILDGSTLRRGEKDSNGDEIAVTAENIAARAGQWKTRLGARVSTNFADITKPASLHYSGKVVPIKSNASAPAGGGNQGGGSDPDDGTLG